MKPLFPRFSTFVLTILCVIHFQESEAQKPVYQDVPFWQDYSVKYYAQAQAGTMLSVDVDRNGTVKILTSTGLYQPSGGQFLQHGHLQPDGTHRTLKDHKISALAVYKDQFVYLTDKAVLSNAWAGKLYATHSLSNANLLVGGSDFQFLVSDGKRLQLIKDQQILWQGSIEDDIVQLRYTANAFWILGKQTLHRLVANQLTKEWEGLDFKAFEVLPDTQKILIGTTNGYFEWDIKTKKVLGDIKRKLPCTDITAVERVGDKIWFGTANGAFALRKDGKFDYYNGERWLPSNTVKHIVKGLDNTVLVLTANGLGQIHFKQTTLQDKAIFYDKQVRSRHIRHGFNASLSGMEKGNVASGYLADSDNDGLWTSMYLGGEAFRYVVTKNPEALQNCRESLDAMERLYSINPVSGFPARSFERHGYKPQLADPERWQHAPDPRWDWKATTSSDEVIGHIFVFGVMAELLPDADIRRRSIALIDTLMGHIVKNNWYLIDYDGKPTTWGRWHPDYVNAFPTNVGDRKLNASNIIGMLQTAFYFTKKEVYRQKAFELMQKHGYLINLLRPIREIGMADPNADAHSKMLSDAWNHSDDEMYFLGYWGLYRYAFNDTLKKQYRGAIIDHWQIERTEKEGLWNIFTALTGTPTFDLNEAVWYLKEHPLDMIDWDIANSHRQDIEKVAPNFRNQTTKEVLPPDERPIQRHNANMFTLDRTRSNGVSEHSAGDIWLLPYWMGRWLGVISGPNPLIVK